MRTELLDTGNNDNGPSLDPILSTIKKTFYIIIYILYSILKTVVITITHANDSRGVCFSPVFSVCLFILTISEKAAAGITKLDIDMFHRKS